MKIDSRFKLRTIAGETLIVQQGKDKDSQTKIISLNSSARMLYEHLAELDFTTEDAAALLQETYGIGRKDAMQDAAQWVKTLKGCQVIVETSSL